MRSTGLALGSVLVAAAVTLGGCSGDSLQTCQLDFGGVVDSNFGEVKLDGLLESASKFGVAARDMDARMLQACNAISTDLGGASANDTETACANAAAAIDGVYTVNAEVVVSLEYVPAVCSASAQAVVDCTADCDASFDANATPPTCTGGMLSGTCSGSCSGSCTVEGEVSCTGSCEGSCSGSCDATVSGTCTGTCNGQCEGTCSATDNEGNCAGECTGTCRGSCTGTIEGTCSGSCEGTCSGSCRADVTGSCSGECTGSCDVDFEAPRCEGGELEVDADVDCSAACEADASFELECTEPEVVVSFSGTIADTDKLADLVATLEANLGTILAVAEQAAIVIDATGELVSRLGAATSAAAGIGVEAADCLRLAVAAQVEATATVSVSVEASASVTASASGSASSQ